MAKRNIKYRNDMREASSRDGPKSSKLHAEDHGRQLRYGKKLEKETHPKNSRHLRSAIVSQQLHKKIEESDQDDNIGTEAVNRSTEVAELAARTAQSAGKKVKQYSQKLHERNAVTESAEKEMLHEAEDAAGKMAEVAVTARATPAGAAAAQAEEAAKSHTLSRFFQKQNIKRQYAQARIGNASGNAAAAALPQATVKEKAKEIFSKAGEYLSKHSGPILIGVALILIIVMLISQLSSCSVMGGSGTGSILGSSYTAEDADIRGANADYTALETDLRSRIDNIEHTHSGYDEYQYDVAEINHNPYVLTSYLTVLFEDYTRAEVQDKLRELFDRQYTLTLREEVQTRYRTETRTGTRKHTDPVTGDVEEEDYEYEVEVPYEYKILHIKLTNNTLESVIAGSGLDDDQMERYVLLNQTLGNRSYLFAGDIYASPVNGSDVLQYDIPGEALSDTKFANMMQEAQKYLGYPYVWGGSSPSTSFDCSGFVCWVINHSGNGWNYGRTTAEGLRQQLSIIPASEAKPGDIIFFQGTYSTAGASHVGIYVGNGKMIHCGNPIQFADINTNYWRQHFYCFGRLP